MSLSIILIVGIVISIAFHFIGVYAKSVKSVWIAILLIWAGAISIATSEIKQKGYESIQEMQGKYKDTDELIHKAMPKVSLYELLTIKQNFMGNRSQK